MIKTKDKYKKNANEYQKTEEKSMLNCYLNDKSIDVEDDKSLIYKLKMSQIELLMENEALKKAQVELEFYCSKYFDLYDLAPVGYCSVNENSYFLELNHTTTLIFDSKKTSLLRSRITSFIIPEYKNIYFMHLNKLFEIKEPQSFELRMCKKDGTAFWAHIESTISKDSQGLLVCNIAIIDISILKREEGELKESEKKYKSLFESARNAILSTAELRRKAEERVLMESSIKPSFDMDKDVFHELHIHKIELEIQNEELINAQISLDISSSKYLKLYEHAPVGYSVIDENGTFLEVNIMAKMLLGIDSETINKYSITNFITYENQDIYYLHRKHLFETFESQSYELKMLKKNGVSFWAHIEASISKNEKDEFICYLVIIDISKFKCIELKLREYIGQLKKDTS